MPAALENPITGPVKNPVPGRLFLVDGNSFCYRAYYAIRHLSNSKGEPTNAIYGFITMIRKLLADHKPDHLAICFDRREPTFRHEKFKDYKAHRKPMPDDLVQQMEPIRDFCRAYRYAVFDRAGFEADDIIGTLAKRAEAEGLEVFIVTGDKDAMQLVTDRVKILNPHKEDMICDRQGVMKRFDGLGPEKVVEVMALTGDASDNIPGVTGIGEKTALKLIQEFGSVEDLYRGLDRIKSKSQREILKAHEQEAILSRELAVIDTAVPVEIDWDKIRLGEPDQAALIELFKRYEFKNLLRETMPSGEPDAGERRYEIIADEASFREWLKKIRTVEAFAFDTETTSENPMEACLVGLSVCWEPRCAYYIPCSSEKHQGPGLPECDVLEALKPVLENPKVAKYGQNIKYDWIVMKRHGVELRGFVFDTMIASYLINPLKMNHNLDDISFECLNVKKTPTGELLGRGKNQITMDRVPLEQIAAYAAEDADCVFRLVPILRAKLEEHGLMGLFTDLEMPLARALAVVEMNGVYLDRPFLEKMSAEAGRELERLTREICSEAGGEFNLNSPKQLADVLFVKMNLPVVKRTKTGPSTDVTVLEKLAERYELPRRILEFREKSKLKSTYLDALPAMILPETGLVHTSYNQTVTATGRLSSSDPNLQNIPIRTEAGRLIRRAFIARPRPGSPGRILSADYSQIELRILAHFSEDPSLMKAFREGLDVHRFTATLLYGVKTGDVTREMRDLAKMINFSILYGKTSYGLSQDLSIPVSEADAFIDNYFRRYSRVREYLESQKEKARRDGFLTTLLGRRAYFPEINSKNAQIRQFAERAAINAPIQGTAADLIKLAMLKIHRRLENGSGQALMIMQVHDELVFDAPEQEISGLESMVKTEMESVYALKVPLEAGLCVSNSWYKE